MGGQVNPINTMETTTLTRVASKEAKEKQMAAILAVSEIVKVVTPEKLMKQFNRNVNDNIKLDRFLSMSIELPKAFDPSTIKDRVLGLLEPTKHEHHGLTKINHQRAILSALENDLLAVEIANKTAWLSTFKLNEEQELQASKAMEYYEKTLSNAISIGTKAWREAYGTGE